MAHKVFISFKTENAEYKRIIQEDLDVDMIDKSLNDPINSEDFDYIMSVIRNDYLKDSTVTIALIGEYSAENNIFENQQYIKRELQASLYNGKNNSKSGILAVILPEMYDKVYTGSYVDENGKKINYVQINDDTVIKEISYNYYIPKNNGVSYWTAEERYVVSVKWSDFKNNPEKYIDQAYDKRSEPIAQKTKVRPK